MRKAGLFLLLCLIVLPCEGKRKQKTDGEYDVFLLIGQSNMAGRGNMQKGDEAPIDGVWILNPDGKPEQASQPLNKYSSIRKGLEQQKFQLGGPFGSSVHEKTGRKVLLVVNARGGSSLERWMPTAGCLTYNQKDGDESANIGKEAPQFYSEAVRRGKEAMKYGAIKAILWHQGEANSSSKKVPYYLDSLSVMVKSLRKDLGLDDRVPFIAGELSYARPSSPGFNRNLERISEFIPNSLVVSAEGLASNSEKDKTHFNRQSVITFGERYADTYLKTTRKR